MIKKHKPLWIRTMISMNINLDEQLADTESDQKNSEQIIQNKNINDLNLRI